jgi:hypothetical protein
MKRPSKAPEPRTWRASIIRRRQEFLGYVRAPDRETAERVAAEQFGLDEEQRKRLALQEQLYKGSS